MAKPRTKLARATLISNGMVWFGLSLMLFEVPHSFWTTAGLVVLPR